MTNEDKIAGSKDPNSKNDENNEFSKENEELEKQLAQLNKDLKHSNIQINRLRLEHKNKKFDYDKDINRLKREVLEKKRILDSKDKDLKKQLQFIEMLKNIKIHWKEQLTSPLNSDKNIAKPPLPTKIDSIRNNEETKKIDNQKSQEILQQININNNVKEKVENIQVQNKKEKANIKINKNYHINKTDKNNKNDENKDQQKKLQSIDIKNENKTEQKVDNDKQDNTNNDKQDNTNNMPKSTLDIRHNEDNVQDMDIVSSSVLVQDPNMNSNAINSRKDSDQELANILANVVFHEGDQDYEKKSADISKIPDPDLSEIMKDVDSIIENTNKFLPKQKQDNITDGK